MTRRRTQHCIAALEQQRDTYLEQRVQAEGVIAALRAEAARPEPAGQDVRALAERIAEGLFRNGNGDRAERLVLWRDSDKRDLGGWCREAVVDRITDALARAYLAAEQRATEAERERDELRMQLAAQDASLTRIAVRQYQGGQA